MTSKTVDYHYSLSMFSQKLSKFQQINLTTEPSNISFTETRKKRGPDKQQEEPDTCHLARLRTPAARRGHGGSNSDQTAGV